MSSFRYGFGFVPNYTRSLGGEETPTVFFSIDTSITTGAETASDKFKFPTVAGNSYNITVYWGDGSSDSITSHNQVEATHTYDSPGIYTVGIALNRSTSDIAFNGSGDAVKMTDITQWGGIEISEGMFDGCSNLTTVTATDAPTIGTTMKRVFKDCSSLIEVTGINNWDVSNVLNFDYVFEGAILFNQNLLERTDFELTIKTDNTGGITNSDQFLLGTRTTGVYDFVVDWGDGSSDAITAFDDPALTHTYATAGTYNLKISGNTYEYPYFSGGDGAKLVSIDNGGILSFGTSANSAFRDSVNLEQLSFINTTGVTNFSSAWNNCTSLTSFPIIDMSAGTVFNDAWRGCSGLTSFPIIDMSAGTNFGFAWRDCSGLTSFPIIDMSAVTNFDYAWFNCNSLTSFPSIQIPLGTNFNSTWRRCTSLTSFPLIDMSSGTNFDGTWRDCALDSTSIDNVMQILVNNGRSNLSTNLSGGTNLGFSNWSAGAVANYNTLISNGWTITTNP